MNVAIFLDDVNEFNGPLMFIPAATSSACSTPARHHDDELSLVTIDHATIARRSPARAVAPRTGRLDDHVPLLLVHASTSNLSPWNG